MYSSYLPLSRRFCRINRSPFVSSQSIRSIFIETEATPNPQSLKFLIKDHQVLPSSYGSGMNFGKNDTRLIRTSSLVKNIFDTNGVQNVYLGMDFITVTKNENETWKLLKPTIFSLIMDQYATNNEIIDSPGSSSSVSVSDTKVLDSDSEIVVVIKELLESKIRPTVQDDGGDIHYVGFDDRTGIVTVRLAGSCVGCPSSTVTLKNGVENMLMHYIPEVKGVEAAGPEEMDNTHALSFRQQEG